MLSRFLLKFLILSRNKKHLKNHKPRLAVYSFDHIAAKIHIDGRFENLELKALEELILERIDPKTVCLDIGANIGNHSIAFSDHFLHVYAFEPNPEVFELLKINAKLKTNITPWNVGLSSKRKKVEVVQNLKNVGSSGIGVYPSNYKGNTIVFKLRTLDNLLKKEETEPISFIKIDVEGHEQQVILGALKTLVKHKPIVALEIRRAESDGQTTPSIEALKSANYKYFYEIRVGSRMNWLGAKARLTPIKHIAKKNYPMLIASQNRLNY